MKLDINKYYKLVEQNETISFDIFDTLVLRNIYQPVDIFKILEREVKEKYGIENFFNLRIEKEHASRQYAENTETTFEMIYAEIANVIGEEIANEIMNREFELECEFIKPNPFMKLVFDKAQELNKKVLLITDMYLTRKEITKLLDITGYSEFEFTLYISSECKKSKHLTDIYPYVKEQENLDYSKWAHFGDNYFSDIENATKYGINAMHYPKVADSAGYNPDNSIELSIMKGIQASTLYNGLNETSYFYKLGAETISPLMYGIANWLYKLVEDEDNMYFFSRDGRLPYEVFNIIKDYNKNDIDTYYLYTSRKAYQVPTLTYDHKNEMINYLTQRNITFGDERSVRDLLEICKLEPEQYAEKAKLFGFDSLDILMEPENEHNIRKFLGYISDDFIEIFKEDLELIKEYLDDMNCNKYKKLNVFDIGWRGSIQRSINQILDTETAGYYFGTNLALYPELISDTFGYCFDFGAPYHRFHQVYHNLMMYELFFSAPEKSLKGFVKENDKVVPQFVSNDEDHTEELEQVLQAVLDYSKEYVKFSKYIEIIEPNQVIRDTEAFIARRDFDDIKNFTSFETNLSLHERTTPFVEIYTKEEILKDKEVFYREIGESLWRNAFLVEGIETKEEYDEFLAKYLPNLEKHITQKVKVLSIKNLKKSIRNPKKAIGYLKRLKNNN